MISKLARPRAPIALSLMAGAALLATALSGCAGKGGIAADPFPNSELATPSASPSPTPTPAPTSTAPAAAPVPGSSDGPAPAPAPAPADPAAARALAVQACQTIADGFAAASVDAAAPLAAQAAAGDAQWQPLATELEFIRTHPIDPQTGAGPQQTVTDSYSAAQNCFTLAGVTVSQD